MEERIEHHHFETPTLICCDNCAFCYSADHTVEGVGTFNPDTGTGGYVCPACHADDLATRCQQLEAALRGATQMLQEIDWGWLHGGGPDLTEVVVAIATARAALEPAP